ncbi:MAG: glycerol kinase GlpK [Planctomycetota bacterium]
MPEYILALDEGTTGVMALLLNPAGEVVQRAYSEFPQYFPKEGWVEHDAEEIYQTTLKVLKEAVVGISANSIKAMGITNQRETTVLWEKKSGKPIAKAIVWQCRRTKEICEKLKSHTELFRKKTGLVLDAYFSGTKIKWLLDQNPKYRDQARRGEILFGTIDTWLLWKLTGGKSHKTDFTNASRTLIYNIYEKKWDEELLQILDIPKQMLPEVQNSASDFGRCTEFLPGLLVGGIAGDQQAALFGQSCHAPGMAKNTYGTGCFLLMNVGSKAVTSNKGLLTTLACDEQGKPIYALEGAVFIAGAGVQWLRDQLQIIKNASETEALASQVSNTGGVYFVPAFVGLGAPYWDMGARGAILGMTRGTGRNHLVRAVLEAIAYQTKEVVDLMSKESGIPIRDLRVDGGACANNFLMQFQADLLQIAVDRPTMIESTALGAGLLAGVYTGTMKQYQRVSERKFYPQISRESEYQGWKLAVKRILTSA